ncbi:DUF1648 domain-containing protein [Psychrobacillus lasiicapitis]|uniref:DUF1648 domain-containing protein n=1 Tax=Psychrobacillus lasiicapitis TaxID=1636719 RepID=A0A544T6H1_9BACI|nr:DUF5808 domain-containing protein [Psychrobacillus lasiicapitis]TQR13045.1 DUF1648 domain-containing protein [Psychrobacillus lasiicapitis]GGA34928.1 membrane protein [Psychrobacillus lasiicapitis]
MIVFLFGFILLFITILQAFTPKLLKQTEAFGVYIPEQYTKETTIVAYKKRYTSVVLTVGIIVLAAYLIWALTQSPTEEVLSIISIGVQFCILFIGLGYYFVMHVRVKRLKEVQGWTTGKKEVRVVDLQFQEKLQLIPRIVFIIPMIITVGLIIYTFMKYAQMPDMIPTHWGPSGQPDAFSEKTYFSAISMPLILLVMQGMFLLMSEGMRFAGAKINPANKKTSVSQQLAFRKYSSWFALFMTITMTLMMGYFHLQTIHPEVGSAWVMFALPLTFLVLTFVGVGIYVVKVGQSGSRLKVEGDSPSLEDKIAVDDDKYWKGGIIYINKDDPSILVEKRFGVGWTLNFGRPISWIVLFGPLILIIVIAFSL